MPNVTGARRRMEREMEKSGTRCTITSDPQGPTDGGLDKTTGRITAPDDDSTVVYRGKCLLGAPQAAGSSTPDSGQDIYRDLYRIRIPVAAAAPPIGAVVTIDANPADVAQIGKTLTVTKVLGSSFPVSRLLGCVDRTRGPRT